MRQCGLGIYDKMCDDITCEDLHLARMVGMGDITCDDLPSDDLNPNEFKNMVLGLMI